MKKKCLAQLLKGHMNVCHHLASVHPSFLVPRKTFTFKYFPLNSLRQITPHVASSLKQHSVGRNVAPPLGHLILILSKDK